MELIKLRPLVEAFENWYKSNPHSESEDAYLEIINNEYISSLNDEEFIAFFIAFAKEGGKIQSMGWRTTPKFEKVLRSEIKTIRPFLEEPFNDSFNELEWIDQIDKFKGFGPGIATIYLNRVDKSKYCVVNDKSAGALKWLGFPMKSKLREKYLQIKRLNLRCNLFSLN